MSVLIREVNAVHSIRRLLTFYWCFVGISFVASVMLGVQGEMFKYSGYPMGGETGALSAARMLQALDVTFYGFTNKLINGLIAESLFLIARAFHAQRIPAHEGEGSKLQETE